MTFTIANLPPEVFDRVRQLADESQKPIEEAAVNALIAGTNDLLIDSDERALANAWEMVVKADSHPIQVRDVSEPPLAKFAVDINDLLAAPGPPHIIADIEFRDPPRVPIVPVDKGPAQFKLCCEIEEMPS